MVTVILNMFSWSTENEGVLYCLSTNKITFVNTSDNKLVLTL